jgi:hypothetical protein
MLFRIKIKLTLMKCGLRTKGRQVPTKEVLLLMIQKAVRRMKVANKRQDLKNKKEIVSLSVKTMRSCVR